MNQNQKINYLAVPITLGIAILITIILAVCGQNWKFFLIGVMTSCLTHGLMVKQNHRMTRMVQLDPEHKVYKPKKSAILWLLLRMLVTFGVFGALFAMSGIKEDKMKAFISIMIALAGYMLLKVVFIILLVTTKKEKEVKE